MTSAEIERIDSFFRFLIKQPADLPNRAVFGVQNIGASYMWHRLGFFTSWTPSNTLVVLCFDLPLILKDSLSTLLNSANRLGSDDPFSFHAILIEELTVMYDRAVWSWRDLVRDLEKLWIIMRKQTVLNVPRIVLWQRT